jgi:hypothetical protein
MYFFAYFSFMNSNLFRFIQGAVIFTAGDAMLLVGVQFWGLRLSLAGVVLVLGFLVAFSLASVLATWNWVVEKAGDTPAFKEPELASETGTEP